MHYPFGGANASKYQKQKTILEILDNASYYEDTDFGGTMRTMLFHMSTVLSLRRELVEHGLLDVPKGNDNAVSITLSCRKRGRELIIRRKTPRVGASPLEQVIDQGKKVLRSKLCGDEGGKLWCLVRLGDPLKGLIL